MANYFKWDYKYPDTMHLYAQGDMQKDWNQTLVTQFNLINACLHGARMKKNKIVRVPEKYREIIESLVFYNADNNTVAGRYVIEFIKEDINYIDVQGVPLKIENFNVVV